MELNKPDVTRTRTIFPLPDVDPNFSVELRRLSSSEMNRIYDRHGYNDKGNRTMARLEKVFRDVVREVVIAVNGATENGAPLDPQADATKLLLLEVPVEIDGERKSLWDVVTAKVQEEEAQELKNSQRSSRTSMAMASAKTSS